MPGQNTGHADGGTGRITIKDLKKAVRMLKKYSVKPPFRIRLPVPGGFREWIVNDEEKAFSQCLAEWKEWNEKEKAGQS